MDNCTLHVGGSVNLTVFLYALTMGQRRMLYSRKFYEVNLYCICTSIYLSIYLYKNKLYVCMFVKRAFAYDVIISI